MDKRLVDGVQCLNLTLNLTLKEVPQRSVKIKIYLNFYASFEIGNVSVKGRQKCEHKK